MCASCRRSPSLLFPDLIWLSLCVCGGVSYFFLCSHTSYGPFCGGVGGGHRPCRRCFALRCVLFFSNGCPWPLSLARNLFCLTQEVVVATQQREETNESKVNDGAIAVAMVATPSSKSLPRTHTHAHTHTHTPTSPLPMSVSRLSPQPFASSFATLCFVCPCLCAAGAGGGGVQFGHTAKTGEQRMTYANEEDANERAGKRQTAARSSATARCTSAVLISFFWPDSLLLPK